MDRLKEAYNKLEELNQTEFEERKVRTILEHIMCPDDQVKDFMHTTRKDSNSDFSGAFTHLASEIASIFPEKDPGSQIYRDSGRDTSNKCSIKRRVAAAASSIHHCKKVRKDNVVKIYDTLKNYYPDEWNKLSCAKN